MKTKPGQTLKGDGLAKIIAKNKQKDVSMTVLAE